MISDAGPGDQTYDRSVDTLRRPSEEEVRRTTVMMISRRGYCAGCGCAVAVADIHVSVCDYAR